MNIIKALSSIVTIVVKYKSINPIVFLTTMLTMFDNRDMQDYQLHT